MTAKPIKIPNVDHPITIDLNTRRVVVTAVGRAIADSAKTLVLREAAYPPVPYIPREDVDMTALKRTDHSTYCPYKGECSYFSISGAARGENAVWTYEAPYDAVIAIKDHLAFYPDRIDAIDEVDE